MKTSQFSITPKKQIGTQTKPFISKKKILTMKNSGDKIQNTQKRNKKNTIKRIRTFYAAFATVDPRNKST